MCYSGRMEKTKMKRVPIHFGLAQHAKLREIAAREGLSVAEMVRRAVDEFLARKVK